MAKQDRSFILIKFLFISLCYCFSRNGYAQLYQTEGIEMVIDQDNDGYSIVPSSNNGFVLYRMLYSSEVNQIELIFSDTTFLQKWKGFLPVERNFDLANYYSNGNEIFLLFYNKIFADKNYILFKIDVETGKYYQYLVRNSIPIHPNQLNVTSKGALIGGYYGFIPVVLFFEFNTQRSKILPGLFNENGELSQIKVNQDETFDLLISAKNFQNQKTIWIKSYSSTGSLLANRVIKTENNNHLLFGNIIQTSDTSKIIAGVYGNKNSDYSKGIFVSHVNALGSQETQYYNFTDLKNFYKFVPVKRENRIKQRIERRKILGKKIRLQYRFIVHELVPYKDYFILLGEVFYPKYKKADNYALGSYMMSQNIVFDGYQYTHAVVLGINKDGELIWDNSFEINDIRSFTLDQFVKMDRQENQIALLYLFNNKIRTKIIKDSTVVEGKSSNTLQVQINKKSDIESKKSINKLDYWYGDYFLAYGVQTIITPTESGVKRNKIFFVNRVRYE